MLVHRWRRMLQQLADQHVKVRLVAASGRRSFVCLFAAAAEHLIEGCKVAGIKDGTLQQIESAHMQGVKRSCEVAAVDRRDDERSNRLKGLDVVPVEDVAAMFFQLVIGIQRPQGLSGEFPKSDEAEFIGRLPCVQEKAKVCWREL